MADEQGIPESVQGALFDFHDAVSNVEDSLGQYFSKPLEELESSAEPLQKAKVELMAVFAANSLHWMYMCTRGEMPTQHPILDELTRVKKYMDRLKELEDRVKAPKLDKQAAKNFIRNALWEPNNNQAVDDDQSQILSAPGTSRANNGYGVSESASSLPDFVEQQLDEVLKRYKNASGPKHKRFTDSAEEEAAEKTTEDASSIGEPAAKKKKIFAYSIA